MGQEEEKRATTGYVGWAMHGLYMVGTVSFLVGAYDAVVSFNDGTGATGAGACWIAAALSFGLLLNGLARR